MIRKLELGPTWTVQSTIERVSPVGSPVRISVPLKGVKRRTVFAAARTLETASALARRAL